MAIDVGKYFCSSGGVAGDSGGIRLCIGVVGAAAVSPLCVAFGELCILCALVGMVIGIVVVVIVIVFGIGCGNSVEYNISASSDSSCCGATFGSVSGTAFVLIKQSDYGGCSARCGAAVLHTCAQAVGGWFHYQGYSVPR